MGGFDADQTFDTAAELIDGFPVEDLHFEVFEKLHLDRTFVAGFEERDLADQPKSFTEATIGNSRTNFVGNQRHNLLKDDLKIGDDGMGI